jgi:hypothetical protein
MYRGVAGEGASGADAPSGGFQLFAKFIFEVKNYFSLNK